MITKTEKLIRSLQGGKTVTTNQLISRTGLQNLSATVSRLRDQGYEIKVFPRLNSKGESVNHYRMVA
jgi:hypothetical protein